MCVEKVDFLGQTKSQELSVLFPHLSLSTSSKGKAQEIMAATAGMLQDPYLDNLNLTTSEHINLYNKAIFGLPEINRYELTGSKWTGFYQELQDYIFIFGFRVAVLVVISRHGAHLTTEFKNIISLYPLITQAMVDLHCEIYGLIIQYQVWGANPQQIMEQHQMMVKNRHSFPNSVSGPSC